MQKRKKERKTNIEGRYVISFKNNVTISFCRGREALQLQISSQILFIAQFSEGKIGYEKERNTLPISGRNFPKDICHRFTRSGKYQHLIVVSLYSRIPIRIRRKKKRTKIYKNSFKNSIKKLISDTIRFEKESSKYIPRDK